MPLTSAARESAQIATLQALHSIHPMGLTARDLLTPVKLGTGQARLDEDDFTSLLHDLEEMGMIKSQAKPLNAAVLIWKRTEAGRAHLETLSLI